MIKISKAKDMSYEEIISRQISEERDVERVVEAIITDVIERGDDALRDYCRRFDGAELDNLQVSEKEIADAVKTVGPEFVEILREAADNIAEFHSLQIEKGFAMTKDNGVVLGQKVTPMEKAGVYVPGGTAPYPSSVLMNVIPAVLAGVKDIVMVTPPDKSGGIVPEILAAAYVSGVSKIFKVGGAQAVAALAYGTESIPKVEKIVGPGNIYVAMAKRKVYGIVDIDMIAGPSEILVIADETGDPVILAADLLSQAEHDKLAASVLVVTSETLAQKVSDELERQIPLLLRAEIARASIDDNSKIIIVDDLWEAAKISNIVAPEHLEISIDEPFSLLGAIKNAGSIFLGKNVPEALGDYFAGPNHVLPTGGTAKFSSPLGVEDFVKRSSYIYYPKAVLQAEGDKIIEFANREGLTAHARTISLRTKGGN